MENTKNQQLLDFFRELKSQDKPSPRNLETDRCNRESQLTGGGGGGKNLPLEQCRVRVLTTLLEIKDALIKETKTSGGLALRGPSLTLISFTLSSPTRFSGWGSKKNSHQNLKYTESTLFSLTKVCLRRKLFYQSLIDLEEQIYPTLATSSLLFSPQEGRKLFWRSQPHSPRLTKRFILNHNTRTCFFLFLQYLTTTSTGFLYNNKKWQLKEL